MQISERKLEANRANAQLSTGPASEAMKAKVSQNAFKHGLTGRFRVLQGESQRAFDAMLERYIQTEQPAEDVERDLVVEMVEAKWLASRAVRFQNGCFLVQPRTAADMEEGMEGFAVRLRELEKYARYQTTQDRIYHRAAAALAKRRKERIAAARGIDSQKRAEAAENRAEAREIRAIAREIRAENQQNRRAERHSLAVNIDQKRFECLQADVITRCDKAARVLHNNMAA